MVVRTTGRTGSLPLNCRTAPENQPPRVNTLNDIDELVTVAITAYATPIRKRALSRIDELCCEEALSDEHVRNLMLCANAPELLSTTSALFDDTDASWAHYCSEDTVDALRAAMKSCQNLSETILLEDAFLYIASNRPDLRKALRRCDPDTFPHPSLFDVALLRHAIEC